MKNGTLALIALIAILVFAVIREHWEHVAGYWPYLILLLCPLMHFFHGHGNGHSHQEKNPSDKK
ncbi:MULTISPECIES: DUF2933 domain-containing protein [Enterobacterales]|uniref:DUF2933 domain-containing protein n=2 Tax=Yersinia TaxID=629 RepID=A0A857EVT1_9GAMM|nr:MULTISPECIES: DUF2933 domain-containing protein [Enterobacterales]EKN3394030.1 DUF2933 domain-containing protein [Yersinia enterocolitica]EKN3528222.1 DUF2933 domain-containing protein [Yersinia enterocolitica]EKN3635439.1 DUF2933 domain-containing protein [Yersinia enterocolitica]EKN3733791.1 DUF2933 domain-containing protein [Yersinia enterocolitica]EKN3831544.1 DUF2933 domain-containing protein [Yersinia enterocolitica]